jgi:hypothetical protein
MKMLRWRKRASACGMAGYCCIHINPTKSPQASQRHLHYNPPSVLWTWAWGAVAVVLLIVSQLGLREHITLSIRLRIIWQPCPLTAATVACGPCSTTGLCGFQATVFSASMVANPLGSAMFFGFVAAESACQIFFQKRQERAQWGEWIL